MQKSLFPTSGAKVNQTAGIDTNGNGISTWSHHENRANDISLYGGKFYAPFDMTCVFHTNISHADGEKVTNTWIPGSSWFYVKASGIMAKSESILINGKTYNFASNGACLNP